MTSSTSPTSSRLLDPATATNVDAGALSEKHPAQEDTATPGEKIRTNSSDNLKGSTTAGEEENTDNSSPGFPSPTPSAREREREMARNGTSMSNRSRASRASQRGPLSRRATWASLFTPEKPIRNQPTFAQSLRHIVTCTWLNVLLIFIPISWAVHFAKLDDTIIFVMSMLAIIPLAKLLGEGTEEIALRVGDTIGGLLNASLGNATELIIAILALVNCQLSVVQSSLLGSILSNLLLVLGMCFFAGGIRFSEQAFSTTAAQLNSSLLVMSVIAILIPAGFHASFDSDVNESKDVLRMSRGIACILLVVYLAYLTFQLFTHAHLYQIGDGATHAGYETWGGHRIMRPAKSVRQAKVTFKPAKKDIENPAAPARTKTMITEEPTEDAPSSADPDVGAVAGNGQGIAAPPAAAANGGSIRQRRRDTSSTHQTTRRGSAAADGGELQDEEAEDEEEEEEEDEGPKMNTLSAVALLVISTVFIGVTSEWLVSSIDGLTRSGALSEEWVGLILLPIVGNAAEHVTAVTTGFKDKMDISIGVAVGSSIQIALFVVPLLVVLAWMMGKPLTLLFDPFESITLFLAVLIVNYTVQDGRTNWMEGFLLMMVYVIIAVAFFFYPAGAADTNATLNLVCT